MRLIKNATACAAWRAACVFLAVVSSVAEPADVVDVVHARSDGAAIAVGVAKRYGYIADAPHIATDTALVPVLPDARAELGNMLASAQPCAYGTFAVVFCELCRRASANTAS